MKLFKKKNLISLAAIIVVLALSFFVFGGLNQIWQKTLITAAYYIIGALGLNLIIGVSGQFSLGHAGFIAIGAYAVGVIFQGDASLANFIFAIIVGVVITCAVALLIAIPTFRLKGDYLAIATLGFSEIIRIVIQNLSITGGASGLSYIQFANIDDRGMFMMMIVAIIIAIIVIVNFVKSSPGRATVSIREDEIASESMGVNLTKYKTIAFLIGASLASISGAFYGPMNFAIMPNMFGFVKSIDFLVIVVLGGMGSLTGTVIAGIFIAVLNTVLQNYSSIRMILYALVLIVVMIVRPEGLLGKKELPDLFRRKKKKEADLNANS